MNTRRPAVSRLKNFSSSVLGPASLAVVVALCLGQMAPAAPKPGVAVKGLRTVLKLTTTMAAAKAAEQAGLNLQNFWEKSVPPGQSMYSVHLRCDRMLWSDWFSKPDIFLVVEYEGGKKMVIPEIEWGWNGSEKIFSFVCPTLPSGAKCGLRLYDDDSLSDAIWKNILATRIQASVSAKAQPVLGPGPVVGGIEAQIAADGIQLLSKEQSPSVRVDAPELIAVAVFDVPKSKCNDHWKLKGNLQIDGKQLGDVVFSHWYTNSIAPYWQYALQPTFLFWSTIALGGIAILAWKPFARWYKKVA